MAKKDIISPTGASVIKEVLASAAPRPGVGDKQASKNQYAVRFADKMAELFARDLSRGLVGITATTKRLGSSAQGKKQLDVNFSTPNLGLALGISLKSVHLRDVGSAGRYTHNMKRNEEELRVEASGYHKRQPYAVMVGVLFLPLESCKDGKKRNPSSFGSFVRKLRPYAGRIDHADELDRFEKLFIGLYDPDGDDLFFFDVEQPPPKSGIPKRRLSYSEFLDAVHRQYMNRNHAEFQWEDGSVEPLNPDEVESSSDHQEAT